MNEFKKELSVKQNKNQDKHNDEEFKQKVANEVFKAIDNIDANTEEEKMMKLEYMMNLHKILDNYEEVREILMQFFKEQKKMENEKDVTI